MAQLWFKFWAKEYLSDGKVRCLSYEKRGILQTLWAFAWEEGSIPSDPEALGMMLGIPTKAMRAHCDWIATFFHPQIDDVSRWISPRLELERLEADERGAKARESALHRWSKRNANAYANALPTQCEQVCESDASQSQSQNTTSSPTPSGPGRAKRVKTENLGDYPSELKEALSSWRELLKGMKNPQVIEAFPMDKRFLPGGPGTNEATWKAWQKRTSSTVHGIPVTDSDILAAVQIMAKTKLGQAVRGERLAAPMLPTLINSDDFVDALTRAVELRQEVERAS